MYFIGNVLSPTLTQPERHDPTFAFTKEEAAVDMKGIPIHMEHDDQMKVGYVTNSWNDTDGKKWIVGKIDDPSMLGSFARNALKKSSSGNAYYTGLSLTHTHTQYANGKTEKKPIEISLCVDPRRDDCRILFVSDSEEVDKTRLVTYKASKKIFKMSDTEVQNASIPENKTTSEQPAEASSQDAPKEPAPAPADAVTPDQKEMMRVIVEQERRLAEFEALKKQVAEEKKKAFETAKAKSEAMAKALVESWSKTLDQADLTDENRQSIIDIAKKFPEESQEFFRVAHCASKKFQQREKQLQEELEASKNADLKKSFNAVMSKTTHVASEKAKNREQTERAHFMDAMNKYRVSGSGRSLMEEVAQIGNIKKRRMY
jgi:hypothetical protein